MAWQRDIDLVVPLWQGGDDVRAAAGAEALARMVPSGGHRLFVSVADGPRRVSGGVRSAGAVAAAQNHLRQLLARQSPQRLLTLGGDCSTGLAPAQYAVARHRGLAVYWVDAHADLSTPAGSPSGKAQGMALRLLLGEGHSDLFGPGPAAAPSQVTLVGARELDPPERRFVDSAALRWVPPPEMTGDPEAVVAGRPPGSPTYVHLDLDVCDPLDLPAVTCPSAEGPAAGTVAACLAAIAAHHDLVGVAICGYAPMADHDPASVQRLLEALGLYDLAEGAAQ